MDENELATETIGAAIEVHKQLGPGLLESVYRDCLIYEIKVRGLSVVKEFALPVDIRKWNFLLLIGRTSLLKKN